MFMLVKIDFNFSICWGKKQVCPAHLNCKIRILRQNCQANFSKSSGKPYFYMFLTPTDTAHPRLIAFTYTTDAKR